MHQAVLIRSQKTKKLMSFESRSTKSPGPGGTLNFISTISLAFGTLFAQYGNPDHALWTIFLTLHGLCRTSKRLFFHAETRSKPIVTTEAITTADSVYQAVAGTYG